MKSLSLGMVYAAAAIAGLAISMGWMVLGMEAPTTRYYVIAVGLVSAITLPMTIIWWRGADEAVREAHKWSWFWGGSVGMVLTFALLGADAVFDGAWLSPFLNGTLTLADAFRGGIFMVLSLMTAGYVIVWALWWLKRK